MTTLLLEQRPDKDASNISFDDIMGEHSYKKTDFLTIMNYIIMIFTMLFHFGLLGSDIYTLIQIYALGNWGDYAAIQYVPISVYKIVFTISIGISLVYLIWSVFLGISVARRHLIVSSYLNQVSRLIHSLRSYERFCILDRISSKSFHEWSSLTIYGSFHYDIYPWLFADTPRQLLNGTTIASTISNSFTSTNIITILKTIATENKEEAVLLSFMTFSFVIWLVFTVKYVVVLLAAGGFIKKNKKNFDMSFKDYCYMIVATSVMDMYEKEEKKTAKILKNRRKIPSFIGRQEADPTPVEMDPIIEEKQYSSYSERKGYNGYDLQKQRTNPFDTPPHNINNYPPPLAIRANTTTDPFISMNPSTQTLDQLPPAKVRNNTNPYIQHADGIYRSHTNDSLSNPFADHRLASDSTTGSSINDNPFADKNGHLGAGYAQLQSQQTGNSYNQVPIPVRGISSLETSDSNRILFNRNDSHPTTIGSYTNRTETSTTSDGQYTNRNEPITSRPQINSRNDSLGSNQRKIYDRSDSIPNSTTQLYSHINDSVTSHQSYHQPYSRNDSTTSHHQKQMIGNSVPSNNQQYNRNNSVPSNHQQLYSRKDSLPRGNGLYSSNNNSAASLGVHSNHSQSIPESSKQIGLQHNRRKPPTELSSDSDNPLYGSKFF